MLKYIRRAIAGYVARRLVKRIRQISTRLFYINCNPDCLCVQKNSEYYDKLRKKLQKELVVAQEKLDEAYIRLV